MILVRCLVQANQITEGQRENLAGQLDRIARDICPDIEQTTPVEWVEVAEGFGFTAGKPSESSVVVSAVPDDTPQESRVQFMRQVCDAWSQETGCSVNDVVVTAVNMSLAKQART